ARTASSPRRSKQTCAALATGGFGAGAGQAPVSRLPGSAASAVARSAAGGAARALLAAAGSGPVLDAVPTPAALASGVDSSASAAVIGGSARPKGTAGAARGGSAPAPGAGRASGETAGDGDASEAGPPGGRAAISRRPRASAPDPASLPAPVAFPGLPASTALVPDAPPAGAWLLPPTDPARPGRSLAGAGPGKVGPGAAEASRGSADSIRPATARAFVPGSPRSSTRRRSGPTWRCMRSGWRTSP